MQELIDDYVLLDVSEGSIADVISRLQELMVRNEMVVPAGVFIIFRALAILEGIGKIMHPHLNTYDFIRPFGAKMIREQFSPKHVWSEVQYRSDQISRFLTGFPSDMKELINQAKSGKLTINISHQGYGYLLKKLDSIVNRLILTFIICSLINASAITSTVAFPQEFMTRFGLPYWSVMGYLLAGICCLILFYAIFRRRRYK